MTAVAPTPAVGVSSRRSRKPLSWLIGTREGIVGLVLMLVVVSVAVVGPFVAPHPLAQPVGVPGADPSSAALLGTDFLGRDVLSRVLYGGLPVIWLSLATICLTYVVGTTIGMIAGLSRSILDPIIMRVVDLFLAFPALLLLLVLLTGAGSSSVVLSVGIVLVLFPGVARLVRTATLKVSTTSYVEAAVARGEGRFAIMWRDVLPNIAQSMLADFGVRFGWAVTLTASVSFLGLGSRPPAANWGLMVAENRTIITDNIWSVLVPAVLLAALTVAVNLLGDAYIKERS